MSRSYLSRVHRARRDIERDERRARNEPSEQDRFARDLLKRVLPPKHKGRQQP